MQRWLWLNTREIKPPPLAFLEPPPAKRCEVLNRPTAKMRHRLFFGYGDREFNSTVANLRQPGFKQKAPPKRG
jgi:hypothetical protein